MAAQRLVVVRGHPTQEELAAIGAAIAEHHARSEPVGDPTPPSRWLRAARLEARGHQPIDNPARLAAH